MSPSFQEREEAGHAPPLTPHLCALPIFEPKVALSNFKQAASEVPFHKNRAYEDQHEFRIVTGHDCDIEFKEEDRDGVTHNVFNGYIPYQGLRLGSLDDIAELLTF